MNYKKLAQIVGIIIAGVWIFCLSMMIGYARIRSQSPTRALPELTTTQQEQTAFSPATTVQDGQLQSGTTAAQVTVGADNNAVTETPIVGNPAWLVSQQQSESAAQTTQSSVPTKKDDIITSYLNAVNELKQTKDFTLVKTNKMQMTIDSLTGGDTIKNIADKLIEQNSPKEPVTYTFSGGVAQETGDAQAGKSPDDVIAPMGKSAQMTASFVKKAESEKVSGGYRIRLEFKSETQTLDETAPGYDGCMEVIELESLGLPSATKLEQLSIVYDNCYIEAEIDSNGRLVWMYHYMQVTKATGQGTYLIIPVEMESHGEFSSEYEISY